MVLGAGKALSWLAHFQRAGVVVDPARFVEVDVAGRALRFLATYLYHNLNVRVLLQGPSMGCISPRDVPIESSALSECIHVGSK